MSSDAAIDEFWRYWTANAAAIESAIHDRTLGDFIEPLSERVRGIDPGLDWEFGKGRVAEHYFCLAPKGDSRLRIVTERWRVRGPGDGSVFEFHAARPGGGYVDSQALDFGEAVFEFSKFRAALKPDEGRERVDVAIYHPAFANVVDKLRATASFITLDAMLGEDDVERFVGTVDFETTEPEGARTLDALVEAVDAMRAQATGERFVLLEWTNAEGRRGFALINRALKRIDHLGFDTHFEVVVPLRSPNAEGLPGQAEADELNALEDELVASLGPHAVNLGRTTTEGLRKILFFAASTGEAASAFDAFARRHVARGVEVHGTADPQWNAAAGY